MFTGTTDEAGQRLHTRERYLDEWATTELEREKRKKINRGGRWVTAIHPESPINFQIQGSGCRSW